MPHCHFDIEKIKAEITKAQAKRFEQLDDADLNGTHARLSLAVMLPYLVCIAEEINRGTELEQMSNGIAMLLAEIFFSYAASVGQGDPDEMPGAISHMLLLLMKCLGHAYERIRAGDVNSVSIAPMESGTA